MLDHVFFREEVTYFKDNMAESDMVQHVYILFYIDYMFKIVKLYLVET